MMSTITFFSILRPALPLTRPVTAIHRWSKQSQLQASTCCICPVRIFTIHPRSCWPKTGDIGSRKRHQRVYFGNSGAGRLSGLSAGAVAHQTRIEHCLFQRFSQAHDGGAFSHYKQSRPEKHYNPFMPGFTHLPYDSLTNVLPINLSPVRPPLCTLGLGHLFRTTVPQRKWQQFCRAHSGGKWRYLRHHEFHK